MIWVLFLGCTSTDDTGPAGALCSTEDRAAPLATGASFSGDVVDVTVTGLDPEPLIVGMNSLTLELSQACTADASMNMPDHGHSGPAGEFVADGTQLTGDGVQFTMGGYWELTLELDCDGTADTVMLAVCVEP